MFNDLEFHKRKYIVEDLEKVFLNLIINDIPSNKRNAIKFLNEIREGITKTQNSVESDIAKSIYFNIIDDLIEKINNIEGHSSDKIKNLIINQIHATNLNNNDNDSYEEIDEEIERLKKKKKQKLDIDYLNLVNINENSNNVNYFKKLNENKKKEYINKLKDLNNITDDKPLLLKLVDLNTSYKNKQLILKNINVFNTLDSSTNEYSKLNNWINSIFNIPFGNYITINNNNNNKKTLNDIKLKLDNKIYGHEIAKNKLLQYIGEILSGNKNTSNIITLQGPPGIGKTALIQNAVADAFNLPFHFISLGGATDSSSLEGFDYTYEGSMYGKISDILIRSKCMNPIIYFDELDKVSETAKGEEIINLLTHMTDSIQNSHFNDKYFNGIDIDLSKVLFIFSCNDISKINKILLDRMYIIKLKSYSNLDKIKIANNYIIPQLLKEFNFENKIKIDDTIIDYIINTYTYEGGIRKLKENLTDIIKEINLRLLLSKKVNNKIIKFPLKITKNSITNDILSYKNKITFDKIHDKPTIGIINGLWASNYGIGGIAPIEVAFCYANNLLELELTGMQGDVMQESMKVAKTVALNKINKNLIKNIIKTMENSKLLGLHIHCPDGATPIDGPSAGCAICIAIYSLLTNKKINNTIAITGELTLQGNITEIGGLSEKIYGALNAGIKTILYPEENDYDLDKILKKNKNLLKQLKFIKINTINDAIKYIF